MSDPRLDPAAEILRYRFVLPLPRLARLMPGSPDPDLLAQRLRADGRFAVVEASGALPGLDRWTPDQLASYDPAFRHLGLRSPQLVLLRSGAGDAVPPAGLGDLLRATVVGLLELRAAPFLASAANEAGRALAVMNAPPDGTGPSTSPPPGPPPPG
jgi:hypothetical protein